VTWLTALSARRRTAWIVIALAIAVIGLVFASPVPDPAAPDSSSGLSAGVQSVQVEKLQQQLPSADVEPALVVASRTDGGRLTSADTEALNQRIAAVRSMAAGGQVPPAQVSDDGTVSMVIVPLSTAGGDEQTNAEVVALRAALARDLPGDVRIQVTGGPGFVADFTKVFDGADTTLLLVTASVVALLLLITYRSPVLWIIPLLIVGAAEQVTIRLVELVLPRLDLATDGSTTGITSVLVFGAATDYALLLIARYREQLRRCDSRFEAMGTALRRTTGAILASGGTVILAVLTLTLASVESNRALGVAAAIGVAVAVVSALVVLPCALVLGGRGLFWPFVPRVGTAATEGRLWGRLGQVVAARPRLVAGSGLLVLAVLAACVPGVRIGLSETEQFRVKPEAVLGAQTLARAFPAGATAPVAITTVPSKATRVAEVAAAVPGVVSATPGEKTADVAEVDVVLRAEPATEASYTAIQQLRRATAAIPGAEAKVGGSIASDLDVKDAQQRDRDLIIPLILALVALVLVILLRSLLAPLLLMLTVVATYFASLGASWLLFRHVFAFPALDDSVLLLSFLFLVALGVDYNIFLVTRAREEAATAGTRDGMLIALRVTGGVITSAGILLAAVFAVLGVLPLLVLTQIGIIVCVGVLLDTLLVRTVIVPALAFTLGERFWWPNRITPRPAAPRPPEPEEAGPEPAGPDHRPARPAAAQP
jgi:RND superfamily putative drug exporter